MNCVVVITQGTLGEVLVSAAKKIVGDVDYIFSLDLEWEATFEEDLERLGDLLAGLDSESNVLIITDMFGSTPHNVAMQFFQPGRVEIVSGVNLPMVVRLACPGIVDKPLSQLAKWIAAKAQRGICTSSAYQWEGPELPLDGTETPGSQEFREEPCDD